LRKEAVRKLLLFPPTTPSLKVLKGEKKVILFEILSFQIVERDSP
jgi:hypothetical protein